MTGHRVHIREGRDNCRCYAGGSDRIVGPYEDAARAGRAISRAAATVAINYAGLDCSVDEALDETFGSSGDADERDHRSHLYYDAWLNLLDGAEQSIVDQMLKDDPQLQVCDDWYCHVCDDEWTGPDSACWNCEQQARGEEASSAG